MGLTTEPQQPWSVGPEANQKTKEAKTEIDIPAVTTSKPGIDQALKNEHETLQKRWAGRRKHISHHSPYYKKQPSTCDMAFLEIVQKCNRGGTNTEWSVTPPRKCAVRTDGEDAEPSQNTTLKRYKTAFLEIIKSAIEEHEHRVDPNTTKEVCRKYRVRGRRGQRDEEKPLSPQYTHAEIETQSCGEQEHLHVLP